MKNLMQMAAVVLGLSTLGACGGGIEGEMKDWKDKVCACKDAECAEKTFTDYRAWTKSKREEAKKMSDDEKKKLGAIEDELKACRRKHKSADGE